MSNYYKPKPNQAQMRQEMKDLEEKSKALFLTVEESERLSYLWNVFGVRFQRWERIDLRDSYHPIAADSLKELDLKHEMAVRGLAKAPSNHVRPTNDKKEEKVKKPTRKEQEAIDRERSGQQSLF